MKIILKNSKLEFQTTKVVFDSVFSAIDNGGYATINCELVNNGIYKLFATDFNVPSGATFQSLNLKASNIGTLSSKSNCIKEYVSTTLDALSIKDTEGDKYMIFTSNADRSSFKIWNQWASGSYAAGGSVRVTIKRIG